jgi:hypothetical protein
VVGNRSGDPLEVVEWVREPGARDPTPKKTGLAWPDTLFSPGHRVVPTPIDDPRIGLSPSTARPGC